MTSSIAQLRSMLPHSSGGQVLVLDKSVAAFKPPDIWEHFVRLPPKIPVAKALLDALTELLNFSTIQQIAEIVARS